MYHLCLLTVQPQNAATPVDISTVFPSVTSTVPPSGNIVICLSFVLMNLVQGHMFEAYKVVNKDFALSEVQNETTGVIGL